ncbi:hypothetical protein Hanom_Chr14g01327641 [Helianthus anomalus]
MRDQFLGPCCSTIFTSVASSCGLQEPLILRGTVAGGSTFLEDGNGMVWFVGRKMLEWKRLRGEGVYEEEKGRLGLTVFGRGVVGMTHKLLVRLF